jgi:hypothetical protein
MVTQNRIGVATVSKAVPESHQTTSVFYALHYHCTPAFCMLQPDVRPQEGELDRMSKKRQGSLLTVGYSPFLATMCLVASLRPQLWTVSSMQPHSCKQMVPHCVVKQVSDNLNCGLRG